MTKHFPGVEAVLHQIELRAAAEDYGNRAAACDAICRACDEVGLSCDDIEAEAHELRARQRDIINHLKGTDHAATCSL